MPHLFGLQMQSNVPFPFISYRSRRQILRNYRNNHSTLCLFQKCSFLCKTQLDSGERMSPTTPSASSTSTSFQHRFPVSRFLSLQPFRTTAYAMANAWKTKSSLGLKSLLHQEGDADAINENETVTGDDACPSQTLDSREEENDGETEAGSNANFCRCDTGLVKNKKIKDKTGDAEFDQPQTDEDLLYFQDGMLFAGAGPGSGSQKVSYSTDLSGPWLAVPSELGFTLDTAARSFVSKVTLRNVSPGYISFLVMPTTPNVFSLSTREGVIPPRHTLDLLITTKRNASQDPQGEAVEVVLRSGFYILATPIYFSSQLSQRKVKVLWRAYGSPLFPVEAAECHLIKRLIPCGEDEKNGGILGSYNLIEQAVLGNWTARVKKLPNLKTMLKRRQRQFELRGEQDELNESDYAKSWMPMELGPEQEKFLKAHFRHLTKSVVRIREEIDIAATITRMTGFTVLAFGLAFFILRYLTIIKDFGANGDWVKDARHNYAK